MLFHVSSSTNRNPDIIMLFHVPHHSDNEYSPFGTEVTPSADQKDGHHDIWREKNTSAGQSLWQYVKRTVQQYMLMAVILWSHVC
jgi:hypothetical protein